MRRPLIAIGVITLVLVAAAATSYLLRIGPLASPAAPRSVVFVAVSRSADEADAREIEAGLGVQRLAGHHHALVHRRSPY